MKKTPSDLSVWQEFIASLDKHNHTHKKKRVSNPIKLPQNSLQTFKAPNSELWNNIISHVETTNTHRDTYIGTNTLKNRVKLQEKIPFSNHLDSGDHFSFNEYENSPTLANELDRKEKKYCSKLLPSNVYTIDLHGCTLKQAYSHFKLSIQLAIAQQKKILKVITGKGRGVKNAQTIQNSFMSWTLEPELNRYIFKVRQALQQDGGAGAYLVFLKKLK